MPLSAVLADEPIYAFNFTPEAWQGLRSQAKDLRFPCCDAGVILKRSPLGTQFFAHARKGNCSTAPETAEHLQAKDIIARSAIDAGWTAETEVKGSDWIADVLVTRGTVKLAFEVQWSRQTKEETEVRQARYAAAGVRALWLMRQKDLPRPSKALPAFLLEKTDDGFCVAVDWQPFIQAAMRRCPLDQFVHSALGHQLIWRPLIGRAVPLAWRVRRQTCEICNAWNQVPILGQLEDVAQLYPINLLGKPEPLIDALLPASIRQRHQFSKLDFGGEIVYESCRKCGASMMDLRYLYGKVIDIPSYQVTLTEAVLDALNNPYVTDLWGLSS